MNIAWGAGKIAASAAKEVLKSVAAENSFGKKVNVHDTLVKVGINTAKGINYIFVQHIYLTLFNKTYCTIPSCLSSILAWEMTSTHPHFHLSLTLPTKR
jgi:hypothetical protein